MIKGYSETIASMILSSFLNLSGNPAYKFIDYELDKKEVFCLAQTIWFESLGQSTLDNKLVGFTVVNRVEDRRWPDDVCSVVYQKDQFSWTRKAAKIDLSTDDKRRKWRKMIETAILILSNNMQDVSNGAKYFHNHSVRPGWTRRLTEVITTKAHRYYR